jgi:hypothetical protein
MSVGSGSLIGTCFSCKKKGFLNPNPLYEPFVPWDQDNKRWVCHACFDECWERSDEEMFSAAERLGKILTALKREEKRKKKNERDPRANSRSD